MTISCGCFSSDLHGFSAFENPSRAAREAEIPGAALQPIVTQGRSTGNRVPLVGQLSCTKSQSLRDHCGSGLAPRTPAEPVRFTVLDSSRARPLPQVIGQASGLCSTCGDNCLAQPLKASAITVGAGLPREHRRSRCHSPCWILRGHAREHRQSRCHSPRWLQANAVPHAPMQRSSRLVATPLGGYCRKASEMAVISCMSLIGSSPGKRLPLQSASWVSTASTLASLSR